MNYFMAELQVVSKMEPKGDQPKAIHELAGGVRRGERFQTLLGVTGSGKTFTMAHVIQELQVPALILCHNKTLAAQLYGEFKSLFPDNAVEFFISYYDYYQPEAYLPHSDTYIEKDTHINDEIEKLRLRATSSLMERRDVIIVASVSCIYGIGSPDYYKSMLLGLKTGEKIDRSKIFERLVDIQYVRNNIDFTQGTFRAKGDVVEIYPAYTENAVRVEMFGTEIERISIINPLTGNRIEDKKYIYIYPAKHFVTPYDVIKRSIDGIRDELKDRLEFFRGDNKLLEAQRLEQKTNFDLEMLTELGHCSGIENYSLYLSGRETGQRPFCLLDFFPDDFLMFIDESHATLPQVRAMYNGDRSRKTVLVDHGFRLPSALDNRPLLFDEFQKFMKNSIFVSATPADFELEKCEGVVVEQIIRPTGLVDPEFVVKPVTGQIDDLLEEIRLVVKRGEKTLVSTLTKRMSEDLKDYFVGFGIRAQYMHSEINSIDRVEILRNLRLDKFDVLVGVNLLREGLDLPEVSLVAILDADKEGFLRSERSLIQTSGRAARNVRGKVILYADNMTKSMLGAISESNRRRKIQNEYNIKHDIKPETIYKSIEEILSVTAVADSKAGLTERVVKDSGRLNYSSLMATKETIEHLEKEMKTAAQMLEFERAAQLRDEIIRLKELAR